MPIAQVNPNFLISAEKLASADAQAKRRDLQPGFC